MVAVAHTDKVPEPRDRLAAHFVHKLGTAIIKERWEINHILACMVLPKNAESIDPVIFTHAPARTNHFVSYYLACYHHHHFNGGLRPNIDKYCESTIITLFYFT